MSEISRRADFDRRMAFLTQTPDLIEPTPERYRQGVVERDSKQLADADGGIGRPFRVANTLALMRRNSMITDEMMGAGEQFQADFGLAALYGIHAAPLDRIPGGGFYEPSSQQRAARDRVWKAVCALGGIASPAGCCAWHVLGIGSGLHAWAIREGWNGRTISPKAAGGILVGALGVLAELYREQDRA